jgi:hypothetical protein
MSRPSAAEFALMSAESYYYYRREGQKPLQSGWRLVDVHNESGNQFSVSIFEKDGLTLPVN